MIRRRQIPDIQSEAACFHWQPGGEKWLKGRLVEAVISFPRTHDLLNCLNLRVAVEPFPDPGATNGGLFSYRVAVQ